MRKVFFGTLISQAQVQLKTVEPKLVRASAGFLTEKSISDAIQELKECQKLLEIAKASLTEPTTQSNSNQLQ